MSKDVDWKRAILHVDADAFFASVEEVLHPQLKGRPVIVGGPASSRGVVSSANYLAREYGVRSAMSMYEALRKCPHATVVCSGFHHYRRFSAQIFEICKKYTPLVEVTSIDEGYLDLTGTEMMHGMELREIAKKLLIEIRRELKISVSGGLSTNKTVAKIASGLNKPHALTTVIPGMERGFLSPLPLRKMPGIGPKTFSVLRNFDFKNIGDIARLSFEKAYDLLGSSGVALWKKAQGIDNRLVAQDLKGQKSISKEKTFSRDQGDPKLLLKVLNTLCKNVLFSLRKQGKKAHAIHLKIRYSDFKTFTFRKVLPGPLDSDFDIFPLIKDMFIQKLSREKKVRLIGFGVSDLRKQYNLSIFTYENEPKNKLLKLGDKLKKKYGAGVIEYGLE